MIQFDYGKKMAMENLVVLLFSKTTMERFMQLIGKIEFRRETMEMSQKRSSVHQQRKQD